MLRPVPVRLLGAAVLAAVIVPLAAKSAGGLFRTVGRGLRKLGEDLEKAADEASSEGVRKAASTAAPETEAKTTKVTSKAAGSGAAKSKPRRRTSAKGTRTTTRKATTRRASSPPASE